MKGRFPTTRWSVVLGAAESGSPESRVALEALCVAYWHPVYTYARALGHGPDDARDLTQGFFAYLLDRHALRVADPERGRFRAFLKATFENYLAGERRRDQAQKRGGSRSLLSLDLDSAESLYRLEPADTSTPHMSYERRWASALLSRALGRLESEMRAASREDRFHRLEPFLTGSGEGSSYRDVAAELGTTESSIKSAVHRMRRRYGRLLRAEVEQTVSDRAEVDAELRHIISVLDS